MIEPPPPTRPSVKPTRLPEATANKSCMISMTASNDRRDARSAEQRRYAIDEPARTACGRGLAAGARAFSRDRQAGALPRLDAAAQEVDLALTGRARQLLRVHVGARTRLAVEDQNRVAGAYRMLGVDLRQRVMPRAGDILAGMLGRRADVDQHGAGLYQFGGALGGNGLHGMVPIRLFLTLVSARR